MPSRRVFAAGALTALGAGRVFGAGDRVRLGVIGTGNRGQYVMEVFAANPDVDLAALCDVYQPNLDAASKIAGTTAEPYRDYRRVLERKDVDAVLIAAPDHWHGPMTAEAVRAGKDVYVEKPVSNTIAGGRILVDAAAKSDRIVQVGIQQRSWPHFRECAEWLRTGALGRLQQVMCLYPGGSRTSSDPVVPVPGDLDWEMFQGPAPRRSYTERRHKAWRGYYDYGGGLITDWGVHLLDTAHMLANDDQPRLASAMFLPADAGKQEQPPDVFSLTWTYDTCLMSFSNVMPPTMGEKGAFGGWGVYVYGQEGFLTVNRSGWMRQATRPLGRAGQNWKPAFETATGRNTSAGKFETGTTHHVRNFLDCVKSRRKPNCDARTGFQSTLPTLLAIESVRAGKTVRWDGQKVTAG